MSSAETESFKQQGNIAYKNKDFEEAIRLYTEAISLDPKNIVYLTNRATASLAKNDIISTKNDCETAIKIGRENFAPFKQIAKAFERLGDAFAKENKLEEAIERYNQSLLECSDKKVKNKLNTIEEKIKEKAKLEYLDTEKALEHKEKGNNYFRESKWEEAVAEYTESIKRNPEDHKVYCNRAAVYSKLMAWEYAINDCDKCIQLDKTFAKAYLRKGKILNLLKEYAKAVATFNNGLEFEPKSSQLIEGKQDTMKEVMTLSREGKFNDEYRKKALEDPDVQKLMADPAVRSVLESLKNQNPDGIRAMSDPEVMKKLEVLIAAGVVQFGM